MKTAFTYSWLILLLLLTRGVVIAQEAASGPKKTEIVQDPRIDQLVSKHIKVNQELVTMDGFRIQLFSDSGNNSKTRAQALQEELMVKYPETGVYLTFKSPNYKIRLGDFRTKLDAQRILNQIAVDYPNAFIVSDQINLPKTD